MYQRDIRYPLPRQTDPEWLVIADQCNDSDTVIFPELFAFHKELHTLADFISESRLAIQWLIKLSDLFPHCLIVGGTVYLKEYNSIFNCTPVMHKGKIAAKYYKRNLYGFEPEFLSAGSKPVEIKFSNVNWGFMICADVLKPDYFLDYSTRANIAIPTASPKKSETIKEQLSRDQEIFGKASQEKSLQLFKCCCIGSLFPKLPDGTITELEYQGRSLIADNGEIIARSPSIEWTGFLNYHKDKSVLMSKI